MTINFPGPWQVRFNYTVNLSKLRNHQHRVNFDVLSLSGNIGDPFTAWTPQERDGDASVNLELQVDAWVALWKPMYGSTMTIVNADLVKYDVGTEVSTWYSSLPIAESGTHTSANKEDAEQIFSFRSTLGSIMKIYMYEGVIAPDDTDQLPLADPAWDAMADDVLSTDNVWRARDDGYPIAFLGFHPGESERLFKDSHR